MTDTDVAAPSDAEVKARRLGWVPKEDFKGDPDKHRSAEDFLQRGEEILPILKRDNEKLHQNFTRVEKQLKETQETLQTYAEFASKAEERAYKRAKAELEGKLDNAIATADPDAAKTARRELAELEADKPVAPKTVKTEEKPQIDPDVQAWIGANPWFDGNAYLRTYMVTQFGQMEAAQPGRAKPELLAEAKQKTMDKFPEEFGINTRRDGAATVATPSGGGGPSKKKGKTYDDLPPEAKAACNKFVKTIPNYTREKYVADYDWEG